MIAEKRLNKVFKKVWKYNRRKPFFAIGHHGTELFSQDEEKKLVNVFNIYDVDMYLCGHAHRVGYKQISGKGRDIHQITCGGGIIGGYPVYSFIHGRFNAISRSVHIMPHSYSDRGDHEWHRDYTLDRKLQRYNILFLNRLLKPMLGWVAGLIILFTLLYFIVQQALPFIVASNTAPMRISSSSSISTETSLPTTTETQPTTTTEAAPTSISTETSLPTTTETQPSTTTETSPSTQAPAPYLVDFAYNTENHIVTGRVDGSDSYEAYGIILYIRQNDQTYEFNLKPDDNRAVNAVGSDGRFRVRAYSSDEAVGTADKKAQYYSVLLVQADLNYEELKKTAIREGEKIWDMAKAAAIDSVWEALTYNPQ
jgi:hypothetical protein